MLAIGEGDLRGSGAGVLAPGLSCPLCTLASQQQQILVPLLAESRGSSLLTSSLQGMIERGGVQEAVEEEIAALALCPVLHWRTVSSWQVTMATPLLLSIAAQADNHRRSEWGREREGVKDAIFRTDVFILLSSCLACFNDSALCVFIQLHDCYLFVPLNMQGFSLI